MRDLRRLPDWRPRLTAYLRAAAGRSFEPGRHDCALFAAGAVQAMTGVDPAAAWRGRYTTLRGGLRVLRRDGIDGHVAAVSATLTEIHPSRAQLGDIMGVPADDGEIALGVLQGEAVYVLAPTGMALVPRMTAVKAWSV